MSHFDVAFQRVTEVGIWLEIVSISSPHLFVGYVAGLFQLGDDPLGRPFCDPNPRRDVACSDSRVLSDRDQYSCVVCEEGPGLRRFIH